MSDQTPVQFNFFFGEQRNRLNNTVHGPNTGFCVWQWAKEKWVIKKNACQGGCVPQEPLTSGRFEGQYRAVICIPKEYRPQSKKA